MTYTQKQSPCWEVHSHGILSLTLTGKGFTQELVKLAGPSLLRLIGHGLQAYEKGASASDALKSSREVLKRGLKCKLPAVVRLAVKTKAKQSYKKKRQHFKDI